MKRAWSSGIAVLNIGSGDCSLPGCACSAAPVPWSYSIGFHERDHPEVVVFGSEPDRAVAMLNWVRRRELTDRPVSGGSIILLDGNWVRFDPLPADWRAIPDDEVMVLTLANNRTVVIRLAARFAPAHIANIRKLVAARWWDGE